jgi:hypothetical protein
MSRLIKEPFAPRRRYSMSNYRRELLMLDYHRHLRRVSFFSCRLKKLLVGVRKLAQGSVDDLSIVVLLVSLLVTILLLPWIL